MSDSHLDALEPRVLFAWGAYPKLTHQDWATQNFPKITGAGALIVTIDSGVNASHPALAGHLWRNPGEIPGDGKDNDGDGYVDDVTGYDFVRNDATPDDEQGHGTATAGIIAASPFTFNGATYAGLAQGVKIIPLKVLDQTGAYTPGAEKRIERALEWVEAMNRRYPITAVNLSLYTPADLYQATYADEIARLTAAGVIVSASGGQDDPNSDVHYPARDPNVWATSVVDETGTMSPNVNRGPNLDLLAPGIRVPIPTPTGSGFVASREGSSNSAAHTTALAALVKQVWPTATAAQVLAVIKDSGRLVKDTTTQYTYSGRSYPLIDVYRAIQLAYERNPATRGTAPQTPYRGTPFTTGQRIEAEDFDAGGEGVAFHDTTAANLGGGPYRPTAVDVSTTADGGGGYVVGYTAAGEWLEYTVDVATAGTYTFSARVASPVAGARFHAEIDGTNVSGSLAVPNTGAWTTYTTVNKAGITLSAGRHVLRVVMEANNGWGYAGNYNYFSLTPSASLPPPPTSSPFTSVDIGGARPAGATTVVTAGRDYDLLAGGADVWGTSDQFRFAYPQVTGDFDVIVRVDSLGNTDPWAKAGLMARESLAADARNVFAFATPGTNGYRLQTRASTAGATTLSAYGGNVAYPNTWLRLRRVGSTFTAYRGTTGTGWTQYATATLTLPATLYVGMAATSHNTSVATTARFRGFQVT